MKALAKKAEFDLVIKDIQTRLARLPRFFPPIKIASARVCRRRAFLTVDTCQRPPRAVGMPRASSAFAIPPKLAMPVAWIARITGRETVSRGRWRRERDWAPTFSYAFSIA